MSENGALLEQRKALSAAIRAEAEERSRRCWMRIAEILQEESCELVARPVIAPDGRTLAETAIVAHDKEA